MTLFPTVTGPMFGRSNKWAKTAERMRDQIYKMKIIQLAKFAAGAGGYTEPTTFADKYGSPHSSQPVIVPAIIEIAGVQFHSSEPKSLADAVKINAVAVEACND